MALKELVLLLLALLVIFSSISKTQPYRHYVSLVLGLLALILGLIMPDKALGYINFDVLGLIVGMSIMSVYMEISGLVDIVASALERRIKNVFTLYFLITLTAGVISIALENVTVVLMIIPIVYALSSKFKIDPRPLAIGVALASNLSGSATMIGDPQAIITAGYFNIGFSDFIVYKGKPSMFFFTIAAMVTSCFTISYIGSKRRISSSNKIFRSEGSTALVKDKVFALETLGFLGLKIVLLTFRSLLNLTLTEVAIIAVTGLSITRLISGDKVSVREALIRGFEWKTVMFLLGVFILSGAFAEQSLAKDVAYAIMSYAGSSLFTLTSALVWISVAVSAFIDNIPYITVMLPVIEEMHVKLGVEAITLAWALLLGATLGGNLTYIGASANVVAVRNLEEHGYRVSFLDFVKLSIPFNTISVVTGWILYEILWVLF